MIKRGQNDITTNLDVWVVAGRPRHGKPTDTPAMQQNVIRRETKPGN